MADGTAVPLGDTKIRYHNKQEWSTVRASWKPKPTSTRTKKFAQTLPGNFSDPGGLEKDRQQILDFLRSALASEREAVLAELSQRHERLLKAISADDLRSVSHSWTSSIPSPPAVAPMMPDSLPGSLSDGRETSEEEPCNEARNHDGDDDDEEIKKQPSNAVTKHPSTTDLFRGPANLEGLPVWHPTVLVNHPFFDAFFCGIIIVNVFIMSLDLQYNGLQLGHDIAYGSYARPAADVWPGASEAFSALEYVFGILFTVEIVLKIIGQTTQFPCFVWNWIDTSIVVFWAVERAFTNDVEIPVPPGLIRLVRMARLLRLVRLVRTVQGFDQLYVMTTAIRGSFKILVWTFVLLLLVQITCAFILNQLLEEFIKDVNQPLAQRHKIFEYFGTTTRAILSMFELALGNWVIIARVLQENVSEYFTIFSIAFKLFVGFAVVGVVNGIFMQETFNVAANDDRIMLQKKQRDQAKHIQKMGTFFKAADSSGDGVLDLAEFQGILENIEIKQWLAAQGLSVGDASNLFRLIDDGDGELSAEEVVKGVERLKGAARSIDLAMHMRHYEKFSADVSSKLGIESTSKSIR